MNKYNDLIEKNKKENKDKYEKLAEYDANRGKKVDLLGSETTGSEKYDKFRQDFQNRYLPRKAKDYYNSIDDINKQYSDYLTDIDKSYQSDADIKLWRTHLKTAYESDKQKYASALAYLDKTGKASDVYDTSINAYKKYGSSLDEISNYYSQFADSSAYQGYLKDIETKKRMDNYDLETAQKRLAEINDPNSEEYNQLLYDIQEVQAYRDLQKEWEENGKDSEKWLNYNVQDAEKRLAEIKEEFEREVGVSKSSEPVIGGGDYWGNEYISQDEHALNMYPDYAELLKDINTAKAKQEYNERYNNDPAFRAEMDKMARLEIQYNLDMSHKSDIEKIANDVGQQFASWAANTLDSAMGIVDLVDFGAAQDAIDTVHGFTDYVNTYDQFSQSRMNRDYGEIGGFIAKSVMQAIPETVSSLSLGFLGKASTAASTGNKVLGTLKTLARSPAAYYTFIREGGSAYNEAKASGANDAEAAIALLSTGLINSTIEMSGGIETVPKLNSASGIRQWIKQVAKTAGEEGLEEIEQGIVSQMVAKVTYAPEMALFSMDGSGVIDPVRMIQEGFGGAVGGLLGGAIGNSVNKISESRYNKAYSDYTISVINNQFNEIGQSLRALPDNSIAKALYSEISVKKEKGEKITKEEYQKFHNAASQEGLNIIRNTLADGLQKNGVVSVESVLPVAEKILTKQEITSSEAQKILDEIPLKNGFNIWLGKNTNAPELSNVLNNARKQSIFDPSSPVQVINAVMNTASSVNDFSFNEAVKQNALLRMAINESNYQYGRKLLGLMEEHERYDLKGTPLPSVTVNGESANITGIDSKTDDGLFVSLDNGSKVNIKDIDFGENSVAEALYNIAAESNLDPKAAKDFIDNYNGSSTIGQYAGMYGAIYNLAKTGAPFEQAQRSYDAAIKYGFISPKAANSAYQSGYISGEASRAAYRQQTEKLRNSQAAYKAEVNDNSDGKATKEQKKLAAVISKTTGYTVELVNGAIDSGIADTQALGSIDTSNAVITLDVSKGNYAATTLHEVTHFIAVNAPEQFARFKNEVIRFEINEGRLASDLNKYAKMYSNIDNINDLTEEMAANAAEALLKSDDFIVDLMSDKKFVQSMAQESPSIAKKIFNKLQELIDAIRDFLKHSDVEHDIARAISKDAQTLETIRGLWLDAFKTAIHNRAVQHENTNNSEESTDNKSSSIKFSKMETYPYDMQTVIREYIDSVDNNIKDFAEYAVQHKNQGWRRIELSSISNKETEDIKNLVNIDVTGYKRTANVNTFVHIEKRHGANGEEDHSLADINDVARMNFVLENYDDIKISRYQNGNIVYSSEFYNSDGSHAIVIQYSKKINGTYYVAEAVPDSKAKELRVTSAYINKKGEYHEPNAEAPRVTSETHHELSPFANNISHSSENVNTQNQTNSAGGKKFSIPEQTDGEYETLLHENEQLHEQVKALRAEMKLTRGHKVRPEAVAKLARKLKNEYSSNINVDDLTKRLEDVFNYVASDDAIANIAHEVMYAIAGDIINNSQRLNTEMMDEYNELRDLIRRTTIFVSDSMKSEIEHLYGDYNSFRKSMFGKMKLSTKVGIDKKSTYIDSFYQDLMSAAPEWFDEVTEQDMLPRIADFLNATDAYMENPYEQDTEQYISDLAQEIFNQYFETPEIKTFADKQQQKLQKVINASRKQIAKLREQNKQQFDKRLAKLKEANTAKIDSLKVKNAEKLLVQKAKYQDMAKRKSDRLRENAEVRKHRESIKKNAKEILRWFDNPSDKKHVPELLRNTVAEFLTSIDFISDMQENNAAKGEPSKEYNFWQAKAERLYRVISEETKVTEEKESGGTAYNFSDLTVELDPDFLSRFNEIIESGKLYKRISDMDSASLKELDTLIISLRHAITSVNKLYTNRITESVAELANMTNEELYSRELKKAHNAIMSKVDKVLNVSMLIPMDFFERMGKGGESIYNSLRNANNEFVRLVDSAQKYTQDLLKDVDVKSWLNSEAYEFDINGDTIKLDVVRIMELYVLWRRDQAKLHITQGGIVPTDIGKGKHVIHSVDPVRIPETKLVEIFQKLTPEQIKVAEAMQDFLSTTVSDWGNEISLQRYGYKKFTEKNYWLINSSDNQIPANDSNTTNTGLFRINNLGMTKSTVKNANNAIVIDDIFKSFSDHIVEMALYASYGPALSDTMKWYNYKDKSGDITKSVKGGIERVYGNEAKKYLEILIKDLNNVKEGYNLEAGLLSSVIGKTKAAAVAGNIRVALQQPTSIVRASAVMNPKYITKGAAAMYRHPKKTTNEVRKYAPIAVWKSWGYYDTNIGRNLQQVITGQQSVKDKIVEKTMLLAQYGDNLTMGSLWEACKSEIADTRADLKVGSDEFFEAAHERYDYIIDRTQVVDGVLQRSQALRNKGNLEKMITAFMSEPTKTFNLLRRAIADYAVKRTKQNAGNLVRTSFATVLTAAFTAAAAAISNAFRDDDESKDWGEKYIDNFFKNLIDNVNPINMIPYAKDIWGAFFGYEPERTDLSPLVGTAQFVRGVYDKIINGKADEINLFNMFYNASKYLSQLTGIPLYNILREADAAIDIFADPIFRKSKTKNSDIYVNMYRAALNGDQKRYEDNYNKLLSDGKTDKEIETSLRSLILDAESEIYDNRVYEAAQHRINGNTSGYIAILDELISESGLSQDFWVKAINSEINRINSEGQEQSEYRQMLIDSGMSVQIVEQMDAEQLKEASENISIDTGDPSSLTAGENLSLYNTVDLTAAITKRSEKDFQEIYRDIISAKTLQYMLQNSDISETDAEKKAVSAVKSSITSNIKPIIKELYSTDKEEFKKLRKFLSAYAGYDSATINKWTID